MDQLSRGGSNSLRGMPQGADGQDLGSGWPALIEAFRAWPVLPPVPAPVHPVSVPEVVPWQLPPPGVTAALAVPPGFPRLKLDVAAPGSGRLGRKAVPASISKGPPGGA
mmetsp:Transcript_16349/g.26848  ORF Transcript_16349/g.26848 Transcript_16349/m.26848 type:complete len:109 (-) Transcript_16349:459-785(-)